VHLVLAGEEEVRGALAPLAAPVGRADADVTLAHTAVVATTRGIRLRSVRVGSSRRGGSVGNDKGSRGGRSRGGRGRSISNEGEIFLFIFLFVLVSTLILIIKIKLLFSLSKRHFRVV
jgi:hypothetical protein